MSEIDKHKTCKEDFQVKDQDGKPMTYADGSPIMASHFDDCWDDDSPPTIVDKAFEAEMDKLFGVKK